MSNPRKYSKEEALKDAKPQDALPNKSELEFKDSVRSRSKNKLHISIPEPVSAPSELKPLSAATADLMIEETIEVLKDVEWELKSSINWPKLSSGGKYRLTPDFDLKKIESGSEHLIIPCVLCESDSKQEIGSVVVKFRIRSLVEKKPHSVNSMSDDHCQGMVKSYNTLHKYLFGNEKFKDIRVVPVAILKGNYEKVHINLWVEEKIDHFQTFTRKKGMCGEKDLSKIEKLATTDEPRLRLLQDFIYQESGDKRTIVDLQGGREKTQDGMMITLCDIEFTDTLREFCYPAQELLKAYLLFSKALEERNVAAITPSQAGVTFFNPSVEVKSNNIEKNIDVTLEDIFPEDQSKQDKVQDLIKEFSHEFSQIKLDLSNGNEKIIIPTLELKKELNRFEREMSSLIQGKATYRWIGNGISFIIKDEEDEGWLEKLHNFIKKAVTLASPLNPSIRKSY